MKIHTERLQMFFEWRDRKKIGKHQIIISTSQFGNTGVLDEKL